MSNDRRAKQVMNWAPEGRKGKTEENCPGTIREDLRGLSLMGMDAIDAGRTGVDGEIAVLHRKD